MSTPEFQMTPIPIGSGQDMSRAVLAIKAAMGDQAAIKELAEMEKIQNAGAGSPDIEAVKRKLAQATRDHITHTKMTADPLQLSGANLTREALIAKLSAVRERSFFRRAFTGWQPVFRAGTYVRHPSWTEGLIRDWGAGVVVHAVSPRSAMKAAMSRVSFPTEETLVARNLPEDTLVAQVGPLGEIRLNWLSSFILEAAPPESWPNKQSTSSGGNIYHRP